MRALPRLIGTLLPLALCLATALPARPPNVVIVLVDDMGYGDIGPFGSKVNRTPALDRLAREGMRLTSFYAAPVCSAARAQLMTGSYAPRVSIPGVLHPISPIGLSPEEATIARLLKAQGYATQCIGKWHLGDQPEFLPTRHGFDHYFGLPYSNDMARVSTETGKRTVPLMRDDQVIAQLTEPEQDALTTQYTAEAIRFMTAHRTEPFFLYFAHTGVHVPLHPGPKFRGQSPHGEFSDWVEELDASTGEVIEALRRLGLERDTLVLFTSDNGPWLKFPRQAGTAAPFRGAKGSTWEGGVRVPTIAWWPGRVPAGTTCDAVAGLIDVLPTFVELGGGRMPEGPVVDGRSLVPILLGQSTESPRPAHFYYLLNELQAVRAGRWKLALKPQVAGMGYEVGSITTPGLRLYDLNTDPGEEKDVAASHPEIVQRLEAEAAGIRRTLGDGKHLPGARPPGRVAQPRGLYPFEPPASAAK